MYVPPVFREDRPEHLAELMRAHNWQITGDGLRPIANLAPPQ